MKELLLAGGCFWCISAPFYRVDGVKKIRSGFCGGKEVNPSYEMVKKHLTHHKETIEITYDENVVDYKKLLDVYFTNIDPFDENGQFIDRGENYSLAVFSDDEDVLNYAKEKIGYLEHKYALKAYVSLLPEMPFYEAEEYHQDFALKHPDLLEKELVESGRKKKN